MKVRHRRTGKDMKIANAVVFMANERTRMEDAVAGDIIGIHNHGQLHIGDTLTEGEALQYKGIPYFAPELFSRPRLRDPLRAKQLNKGLLELGEEGAVQVFEPFTDNTLLIGAVGQLQFEVVAHRLKTEYGVDASFENAGIYTARWVTCPDAQHLAEFTKANTLKLAKDVDGNLVYLADTRVNLQLVQERWPKVAFHDTREHGQLLG
jgi:peptide chain release factor 3